MLIGPPWGTFGGSLRLFLFVHTLTPFTAALLLLCIVYTCTDMIVYSSIIHMIYTSNTDSSSIAILPNASIHRVNSRNTREADSVQQYLYIDIDHQRSTSPRGRQDNQARSNKQTRSPWTDCSSNTTYSTAVFHSGSQNIHALLLRYSCVHYYYYV